MANTSTFMYKGEATQDTTFFSGLNLGTGSTAAYDSSQFHAGLGSLKTVVANSGQTASPYTFDSYAGVNTVTDAGADIAFWFRTSSNAPASLTNLLMLLTSGNGSGRMGIGLNTNGTLNFAQKGATQANGSTVLSANTWYQIGLSYTNVTTSTWAAKVYINNVLEINASAGVQGNATANGIACVSFGQNSSSLGSFSTPGISTFWFDSIYIDNRSDLTNVGLIDVTGKRPFDNGTTNGFTTQIGSGGSGYGSGHTPQVNERPLSQTNGWSMVGAGSAITEEYSIESASAGDVSLTGATIVDYMGWVYPKALVAETANIIVGGTSSNISVTTSPSLFLKAKGSTTYPAGGTDIGVITSTTVTTFSLYECGILVAYFPAVAKTKTQSSVARIAVNKTLTQSSVARIAINKTLTQSAISRVAVNSTKTQSAVSRIQETVTKTQPTVARVATNLTKTQATLARIAENYTKTQSSTARVATNPTKTQSSVARVATNLNKTQPVVSRISVNLTKTQATTARVAVNLTKTQSSVARLLAASNKTQPSIARIALNLTKTQSAIARIAINKTLTQGTISRIAVNKAITQPLTARISVSPTKTQSVVSRIQVNSTLAQSATARIITSATPPSFFVMF